MNATTPILSKRASSSPTGKPCERGSLLDFALEHFGSLAYADKDGWVYVARAVNSHGGEVCKVGFSMAPENRIRELNRATPFRNSQLVVAVRGRMIDEMAFHHMMAPYRLNEVHKEWYLPSPRIDVFAAYMIEHNALPSEIINLGHALAAEFIIKRLKKKSSHSAGRFLLGRPINESARKRMERRRTP